MFLSHLRFEPEASTEHLEEIHYRPARDLVLDALQEVLAL
jgi:hypothetical protein